MKQGKQVTALQILSNRIKLLQGATEEWHFTVTRIVEREYANAAMLSALLKELSVAYGIAKTTLITTLSRHQVFFKKLSLPPCPEDELPALLRFEMDKHLAFPSETAVIDYVHPMSSSAPNAEWCAASSTTCVQQLLTPFKAAGILPDVISLTPVAIANALPFVKETPSTFAVISVESDHWEISIFSNGHLLLSRGFPRTAGIDSAELIELIKHETFSTITMTYIANKSLHLDTLYYVPTREMLEILPPLADMLQTKLVELQLTTEAHTVQIHSAAGIDSTMLNQYAYLLGLALRIPHEVNLLPIDLQQKSENTRRRKKQLTGAAIAAGVLVILTAAWYGFTYNTSSTRRYIMQRIETNKPEILRLAKLDKHIKHILHFKENNLLSLDILNDLSLHLPSGVYIRQFDYNYGENTVSIRGRAASFATASGVLSQLGKSGLFTEVKSKGAYEVKAGNQNLVDFEINCTLNRKSAYEKE
jgi:hypothetical protein